MRKMLLALAVLLAASAHAADQPGASSFAWRGALESAGISGLARLDVPADALARLQSPTAADMRMFDAQGNAVPFALAVPARPAAGARAESASFRALPLYATAAGASSPPGSVQVRINENGGQRSLWVHLGAAASGSTAPSQPTTTAVPAALFDTRAQRSPVTGLVVRAQLPRNVPLQFTVATSADLATWQDVPVRGRLYRFEGEGAPSNDRLEFAAPLQLQDRYLRLAWAGQQGVQVESVTGLLAAADPPPAYPAVALPAPQADGDALQWSLGFSTPIARLELVTPRANTLVPLRILGRNQPSEPWRVLAHTVVYRLGAAAEESVNPAIVLSAAHTRWLRLEATHGARLQDIPLAARVLFEPLQVVFVAGNTGPYELAAGSAGVSSTALPLAMVMAITTRPLEALPVARIGKVTSAAPPAPGWWTPLLPAGIDSRAAGLWVVLALAVLILGGVAWTLVRQLNASRG